MLVSHPGILYTRAVHRSESPDKSDVNHPTRRQYRRFRPLFRSAAVQKLKFLWVSVVIWKKSLNPTRPNYLYVITIICQVSDIIPMQTYTFPRIFFVFPRLSSQEMTCISYSQRHKSIGHIFRITLNLLYYQYNFWLTLYLSNLLFLNNFL